MRHSRVAGHTALTFLLVAFPISAEETSTPSAPTTSPPVSSGGTAGTAGAGQAPSGDTSAGASAGSATATSDLSPPSEPLASSSAAAQTTGGADAQARATQPAAGDTAPAAAPETAPPPPPPPQAYTPPPPTSRAPYAYTGPRKLMLLLGPGFGFSFMYPKAINNYLDHWAERRGVEIQDGSTAIILSLMPRVAVTFAPIEYVQIQVVGEIGWAPKVLTVLNSDMDSSTESFHFLRYSTGGTLTGHLPVAHGRGSVSLGGGALFNMLKFRSYQEIAPGYRGVVGYRFYGRRAFSPEIFFEFNYIKAETSRKPGVYDPDGIDELNYTSGTIGVNFYFKVSER